MERRDWFELLRKVGLEKLGEVDPVIYELAHYAGAATQIHFIRAFFERFGIANEPEVKEALQHFEREAKARLVDAIMERDPTLISFILIAPRARDEHERRLKPRKV